MDVSFIVPCYNEEACVRAFYQSFCGVFEDECPIPWRLVMVDDGSTDSTWQLLRDIAQQDKRVAVIQFSRNFGKESAIYAGLEHCSTSIVGIIDADLQQRPDTAIQMLEILLADDEVDCVAAYQERRKESFTASLLKGAFYRVFSTSIGTDVVRGASDFRVFRRQVADALLSMGERQRFSKGLFSWVGFKTVPFPYVPDSRAAGDSKWSVCSLFRYAWRSITSFSAWPLRMITFIGILVSLAAFVYALVLIIKTLALGVDVPGYATIVVAILLLGGVQLLSLGVIGEYLAQAFEQGKERPIYIARRVLNEPTGEANADGSQA